jgi:hypothetical protein
MIAQMWLQIGLVLLIAFLLSFPVGRYLTTLSWIGGAGWIRSSIRSRSLVRAAIGWSHRLWYAFQSNLHGYCYSTKSFDREHGPTILKLDGTPSELGPMWGSDRTVMSFVVPGQRIRFEVGRDRPNSRSRF